jgi:hypothetical protein
VLRQRRVTTKARRSSKFHQGELPSSSRAERNQSPLPAAQEKEAPHFLRESSSFFEAWW